MHAGIPWFELQAFPHCPQFLTSPLRSDSQPFVAVLSQFPKPVLHVIWQAPLTQRGDPFTVLHAMAQLPQC